MRPLVESLAELEKLTKTEPIKTLGQVFADAGEELALVGGPVRDILLGRPVNDLDFATSASPEKTQQILAPIASKIWDVGREFGTIAARVKKHTVEITTYRSDVYHSASRKPVVQFGDKIEDDLLRRDFKVNALAVMLPEVRLVDVPGGLEELFAGVLDTPIEPEVSFNDDPLRMMRAARFAAQLGFSVSDRVQQAMRDMAHRLEIISKERVRDEFVKLMGADNPVPGVELLVDTGLADQFLPELPLLRQASDAQHRHKDVYEHSLVVLKQAVELEFARRAEDVTEPDVVLRIAALLHDIGKPKTRRFENGAVTFYNHDLVGARMAKVRLRELRFDNQSIKSIARLIELHLRFFGYKDSGWTDSAVRRYVRDAGDELERLHILTRADVTTQNVRKARMLSGAYDDLERRIAQLAEEEALAAVRPDLDGVQIMQILGIQGGPMVGKAYKFLLELRLDNGPLGEDVAKEKLLDWWQEQQ